MANSNRLTTGSIITALALASGFFSLEANATVYKWRNERGVMQYSDTPPAKASYSTASRSEVINALQKKEKCEISPNLVKNESLASKKVSSNFFGSSGLKLGDSTATTPQGIASTAAVGTKTTSSTTKPIRLASAPLPIKTSTGNTGTSTPIKTGLTPTATPKPAGTQVATNTPTNSPVTPAPSSPIAPAPSKENTSDSSNIVQKALMPAVDINKNITQAVGFSDMRVATSSLVKDIPPVGDGDGQFRIDCDPSHMSNDDPLVYPNQPGAAHHHTFYGNTSINYATDVNNVSNVGKSTCRGGIANRSAYWMPSMIDTATNTPMSAKGLWYYKTGYIVAKSKITAPPKGLRMIVGNMKATSGQAEHISYTCQMPNGAASPPATNYVPSCPQGGTIVSHISFPQCWDGKNLDSPDHQSHMTYPTVPQGCPVSHPIAIPKISLNSWYPVTSPDGTKFWRLSSDNYAVNGYNGGYSGHADWINGWDEGVMNKVVNQCLRAGVDCGNHMIGKTPGVGYEIIYKETAP